MYNSMIVIYCIILYVPFYAILKMLTSTKVVWVFLFCFVFLQRHCVELHQIAHV